ncbi:MAG: glycosyltransferase family 2 protein [Actinomycetales bacterium]|nr:glycosyltransferase family 2 protein [Actinomycetales bacterium]
MTAEPREGSARGVSVVMPVLNEERHLASAVERILQSRYDGPIQVVLALGPSTDGTDDVASRLAAADPRVIAVANPTGRTAAGLNLAIAAAAYDIIVRVDGHALIPDDYIAVAVATLDATGADNVGGIMGAEGVSDFEQAVAAAMTSWFGVGGAAFHIGGEAGPALTVYLGCFRRSALERVGGFDESMVRAQDWELNHRIRQTGGLVWFTPDLHVTYRPRPNLRALAKQYFEYGRWRREVARRHPETLSARYLAPPVTLVAVVGGTALGIAGLATGSRTATILGFALPAGYAAANLLASARAARGVPPAVALRLPAVFATMHGAWGAGFIRGAR